MLEKIRLFITSIILPAIRLISKLGKPEPLCDDSDYIAIISKARPGDVLLSKENTRLSNLLISGFWSHAAIVLDDGILEATPPKCRVVSFGRFVFSKDHICLLRPKFPIVFVDRSSYYLGDEYDFSFYSGNGAWYCSELVFDYLRSVAPEMPFVLRKTWGAETSTPDDFIKASDKFEVIYMRKNER